MSLRCTRVFLLVAAGFLFRAKEICSLRPPPGSRRLAICQQPVIGPASCREIRSEPCVIVSNHCSWVDILVHMSRFFPAFVARDSTKHLMLIGLIR